MTSADTDRRRGRSATRKQLSRTAWDRVRAGLSLGVILGLGATGTLAAWSDTATAESGLFGAANVELTINGDSPTHVSAPINNVMPGQSVAGNLKLVNEGGIDLRYGMDMKVGGSSTTVTTAGQQRGDAGALGNSLTLTVYNGPIVGTSCSGQQISTAVTPQLMNVGDSRPVLNIFRRVDGGATDSLCFQASLASNAPIQSRMAQVDVTFIVNAEVV